ncbi:dTDP-4-amino-4,6-dideoxygalactose transaminase [Pedobacter sp. AK013]|uniref:aminotransferase class V-fold PLP-dependent enzyme n=1 Tax=Pedobacter sp. AK013 TaxID=2723071 RepID=UPI0016152E3A|nr:aminotransferase class V-fold PLP-dependent enzyme [Pedobacter sp. AK013]MBB6240042.1 dTDP-4-amino-4,6-dideoxygalactose transaminase [Pedobacter sp. AK013]
MIARGRLDIRFAELFWAAMYSIGSTCGLKKERPNFSEGQLPCLSVRTGLHLVLEALNLQPGDEILVADVNIPDIFAIIASYHLKIVPLPIDKNTLGLSAGQIEAAITTKTKLLLITHLFGAIMDTEPLLDIAKLHHLIVIEDCAQAYDGVYEGNFRSDVAMFSFGLIKTNTALSGAILYIRNEELLAAVKILNNRLPLQNGGRYFKKILTAALINMLTARWPFTIAYWLCKQLGKDFDAFITGFTRSFPGRDLMRKIKYRPCYANLCMLRRKLSNFNRSHIHKRRILTTQLLEDVDSRNIIGNANLWHSHWVIPILVANPSLLIDKLRENGFDATSKASSLVKMGFSDFLSESSNELTLQNLVYLPMDVEMGKNKVKQLNQLLLGNLLNE